MGDAPFIGSAGGGSRHAISSQESLTLLQKGYSIRVESLKIQYGKHHQNNIPVRN